MKTNIVLKSLIGFVVLLCTLTWSPRPTYALDSIQDLPTQDEGPLPPKPVPDSEAHSTTGPEPPPGIDREGASINATSGTTIAGVPAYNWYRGCGPTAAGMVIGYWDGQGYDGLVSGNAATQTTAVNAMIASTEHYNDYALPIDSSPNLLLDKSEDPVGDEHSDNSVADFMKTSQSYYGSYYGWSYLHHIPTALENYFSYVAPGLSVSAQNHTFNEMTWNQYKAEIDAGRPMVLLVDTDGNGGTDHFVTAIGYDDSSGTPYYGIYDTWNTSIHWYQWRIIASGYGWGIHSATTFEIHDPPPIPGPFDDVPGDHWAADYIEALANAGVTSGCGDGNYCPNDPVTRAQMAVFLERAKRGDSFTPPAATGMFGDVPTSHWAAGWVEQLANDGVTGGCGGGNYCPEDPVTRAQMAVFLERADRGSTFVPPTATGMFGDVPTDYWAADWIEQLANDGITSGCGGGSYCPENPVTRAQMAVFLVTAFDLPMP